MSGEQPPEPQAIQILDDLLGGLPSSVNPAKRVNETVEEIGTPALPPPTPVSAVPATAATQAAGAATTNPPSNQPPAPKAAPQAPTMSVIVPRGTVVSTNSHQEPVALDLTKDGSFEQNLTTLLVKDLQLAQHDRAMAIALFQVHLDRAEHLDSMQLSMPVAQVIADNTGATLKALELSMKAGERVHKVAELLANTQKNNDIAALNALKLKQANQGDGWGDEVPR